MAAAYLGFLGLIALERFVELLVARRNLRRLRARGAVESGGGHFPAMVAIHALLLPAGAAEVLFLDRPFVPVLGLPMLALAVLAQTLRWWTIATLGDRWNVRILVEPGVPAVACGPFRFLRHPNYVAVTVEMAAIPLLHSAWITAALFSAANALLLLGFRIPAEERALSEHCDWESRLGRGAPRGAP